MQLARVTGTITATAKSAQLVGEKMLICDVTDAHGAIIEAACIAIDTVGAGVGDQVLVVRGSAARMALQANVAPVDAAVIAIVDTITVKAK